MKTFFASPKKTDKEKLTQEIKTVNDHQLISSLLESVGGLLAVLDENRQVIAINDEFMQSLNIDNPEGVLGLRLGETLNCKHAFKEPAGCGTTKYCATCGAAVAIVSSQKDDTPIEKLCALEAIRGDQKVDMAFAVKSQPIRIGDDRFLLIFLQDVTKIEQRAALERAFYHDINNMLTMLLQASELQLSKAPSKLATIIYETSQRLIKEVSIQRCLSNDSSANYIPMWSNFSTEKVFEQLSSFFKNHPSANGKEIIFTNELKDIQLKSDLNLLIRVLSNMIINACEASDEGQTIKVWSSQENDKITFNIWNQSHIDENVSRRIFQRNFSTKQGKGRGIGTFSMKLFGEDILGGKVSFKSSPEEGTTFSFCQNLS